MAGRVDEVDEEARAILALLNAVQVVLRELVEEGDGGGDRNSTRLKYSHTKISIMKS